MSIFSIEYFSSLLVCRFSLSQVSVQSPAKIDKFNQKGHAHSVCATFGAMAVSFKNILTGPRGAIAFLVSSRPQSAFAPPRPAPTAWPMLCLCVHVMQVRSSVIQEAFFSCCVAGHQVHRARLRLRVLRARKTAAQTVRIV